jgi:hypothetical protein
MEATSHLYDTATVTLRIACPITTDQNALRAPELVWAVKKKKTHPSRELKPDSSLVYPAVQ